MLCLELCPGQLSEQQSSDLDSDFSELCQNKIDFFLRIADSNFLVPNFHEKGFTGLVLPFNSNNCSAHSPSMA